MLFNTVEAKSYRQFQSELKQAREEGYDVRVKLNAGYAVLRDEYLRLASEVEVMTVGEYEPWVNDGDDEEYVDTEENLPDSETIEPYDFTELDKAIEERWDREGQMDGLLFCELPVWDEVDEAEVLNGDYEDVDGTNVCDDSVQLHDMESNEMSYQEKWMAEMAMVISFISGVYKVLRGVIEIGLLVIACLACLVLELGSKALIGVIKVVQLMGTALKHDVVKGKAFREGLALAYSH